MARFHLEQHQDSVHVETVFNTERLQELCQSWQTLDVIAVDTEFDRTNTYFHRLALIQIYDGEEVYLIDPLAFDDISALTDIFKSTSVVKAFHSCSEDLEALYHQYGFELNQVFDTQIAASLDGIGLSVGYGNIVEHFLSLVLDKEHTKTDWLQRPLSQEQKVYAAQDVQYLLPVYFRLRDSLLEKGLFECVIEDVNSIFSAIVQADDYSEAYLKVKGAFRLNQFQLNRLQKLAQWRETLARDNNIPKTFVFRDHHLIEVCQKEKTTISDLLSMGCNRGSIRKYGAELIRQIELADQVSKTEWPEPLQPFHKIPQSKKMFSALKAEVEKVSQEHNIPAEALCNRRLIEYYIKMTLGYKGRPNRFWNSWRQNLLEQPFKQAMQEFL